MGYKGTVIRGGTNVNTLGKSINLFLMDSTPTGRIKVTLANWTGVTYKIPRTELERCRDLDILKQSGVYFLFGATEDTGEDVVYVGQAGARKNGEGILYRLQEHKRNPDKDYWTEAVVFTTSNNSFGPTEISFLENRFCRIATEAKRYIIKNANDPTPGHITEEKESELEEFIEYAKIVMGTLGHKVFEPLTMKSVMPVGEIGSESGRPAFRIMRSGADAQGRLTSEGFVVLSGSLIRKDVVPSCPDYVKDAREVHSGMIDAESGMLKGDILFKSPSGAAAFVLGAPASGNAEWKTEDGMTLKEVERNE